MSYRIGITPKIVLLSIVLLLSTAVASILLNRRYYWQNTREQHWGTSTIKMLRELLNRAGSRA